MDCGVTISNGITPDNFAAMRKVCDMSQLDSVLVSRAINGSLFSLSAMNGSRIVGMARIVGDGAFAFNLYDLLVAPAWRRRGIGTMIMQEVMRRVAKYRESEEWAVLSLFCAQGKEGFYSRLGFRELDGGLFGSGMQRIYKASELQSGQNINTAERMNLV